MLSRRNPKPCITHQRVEAKTGGEIEAIACALVFQSNQLFGRWLRGFAYVLRFQQIN